MNLSIKAKLLDFNKITFIALGLAGFMLSACQSTNPKLVNGNKPIESSVVIEVVDTAPSVFTFNTYLLNGITQEASILIESQILAESISYSKRRHDDGFCKFCFTDLPTDLR